VKRERKGVRKTSNSARAEKRKGGSAGAWGRTRRAAESRKVNFEKRKSSIAAMSSFGKKGREQELPYRELGKDTGIRTKEGSPRRRGNGNGIEGLRKHKGKEN